MKRMGTVLVSLATLAALLALVAAASAGPKDGPFLMIRDKEPDLGTFFEGTDIEYSFILRNTGVGELHILSVRPG